MTALVVTSPATLLDMAELVGATTPLLWAVAREMHRSGDTWAVHDAGGRLLMLAGLYPLGAGVAEAWFNVRPEAAAHMLAIVRGMRLTLDASHYREIVTIVRTPAGAQLAKLAGFEFFSDEEGELHGCAYRKRCGAAETGAGGAAAAQLG